MSVAELAPREDFERTPPHDIAAEQCVLGGMMLSKDAISDVLEVIKPADHYRPAHQIVHEIILDLYSRGEPADAVTVAAELTKKGDIGKVGGAPYLHTLIASVPTAANAGYYARIVRERAVLRRLVEVGTRIVQLGYAGDADADELVDLAQAEVYGVTERRVSDDYLPLSEIMPSTLVEIEAIGSRGGTMTGVPTGFADLDALTNGLHPGQMVVIAARPALGKALALDTPLATPRGWTTMGEVQVGDELLGADGRPTNVVAATQVMTGRACYEVEFTDGEVIVADGQHQWLTWTGAARHHDAQPGGHRREFADPVPSAVVTTKQIAATLYSRTTDPRPNHAIQICGSLQLPDADLPIPPYALGCWLGDGHSAGARMTVSEPELLMHIEASGLEVDLQSGWSSHESVSTRLRELGVLRNKHIPMAYLRASERQRRELLAGILDTEGTFGNTGSVQLAITNLELAHGVRELIQSLGYLCPITARRVRSRSEQSSVWYQLNFTTSDTVFKLSRKQIAHKERLRRHPQRTRWHYITAVRPVASVPVRCVQVDSADRLYLAGRNMIPTHNSTLALDLARAASIKHGLTSVIFSLEMSRNEITMKLLAAEARVALHSMRTGQMSDDDWTRLARRMSEVANAPLFIDDSPNMSMMEIRAKCRRLKQQHDLRLVIVDYLQLMTSPKRVENRQQEVSDLSRSLKLLAKELNVPVIAVAQLNRGPEQRTDKRPMLSDLRESGCLTADTALLRADTGAPITMQELIDNGHEGISVWSLDEHQRIVAAPVTNVFSSGVKQVYLLKLASGREVKASGNHPFLTFEGWRRLEELSAGDRVAVPRRLPEPLGAGLGWTEERLGLLAHLIGDGCVLRSQPVHYTSNDKANLDFVERAAASEFGIKSRRVAQKSLWHSYLPAPYRCTHGRYNPLHVWFRGLGIENLRSGEKRIPQVLYAASDKEIAIFLRHLWATDGCTWNPPGNSTPTAYYASSSRQLADGVALLLGRLGIVAQIRQVTKAGYDPSYHVIIADGPSLHRFCRDVGAHGRRGETAKRLLRVLQERTANPDADTVPIEVWNLVKAERLRAGLSERQFQAAIGTHFCGPTLYKSCPTRERLHRCAVALNSSALEAAATTDVFWDRIASIEPLGPRLVYDATVKGTHNFIADGIFAHNSIEQDSDVVILLHREDAYERESPRAGEADFIVAKHRNGPTTTVTVAFQGHYSRFVDMARI
ncbi:MAG: replicative DNA helicase [Streptosporangiaceae bacterium]